MNLERNSREKSAFVLRPQDIRRLADNLATNFGELRFVARCADNHSRYMTLDEIIDYENPKGRRVKTLSLSNNYPSDNRISIKMTDGEYDISITGNFDAVNQGGRVVGEWIEGLRPRYSLFTYIPLSFFSVGLLLQIVLLVTVLLLLQSYLDIIPAVRDLEGADDIFFSMVLSLLSSSLIIPTYSRIFPSGVFAIGQGEKRYAKQDLFRQIVIAGGLVSAAVTGIFAIF